MEILVGIFVLVLLALIILLEGLLFPVLGFFVCKSFGLPEKNFWNLRDWLVGNAVVALFLGISYLIGSIIL